MCKKLWPVRQRLVDNWGEYFFPVRQDFFRQNVRKIFSQYDWDYIVLSESDIIFIIKNLSENIFPPKNLNPPPTDNWSLPCMRNKPLPLSACLVRTGFRWQVDMWQSGGLEWWTSPWAETPPSLSQLTTASCANCYLHLTDHQEHVSAQTARPREEVRSSYRTTRMRSVRDMPAQHYN